MNRLYFDLDRNELLTAPRGGAIASMRLKTRTGYPISITLVRGRTIVTATTAVLTLALKRQESSAEFLAVAEDFEETSNVWDAVLDTNTEEAIAALGSESSVPCVMELTAAIDGGELVRSQTIHVALLPAVATGDEGTPSAQSTPDAYVAARAVLFDRVQTLSGPQAAQARANIGVAQDPSPDGANELYVGTDGVRFRGVDADGRLKAGDGYFELLWNPDGASPERAFWRFDSNSTFCPTLTFSGTADRLFEFPDQAGTVALLSDCEISGEVLISATTVIDPTHMGKRLRNISGMTQGLVLASPTTGTEGKSFVVDARTNGYTFSGAAPIGPAGAVATAPAGGMYVVRAVDGAWMISGLTSSQVMLLTGDQTAAGQKTFSTSPISTGTPTLGTHMLNRDQVDARYGQRLFAELASDSAPVVSSTNYADTGLELTLSAGVWEVFALVAVESANSAAGGRLRLAADASVDWHLLSIAPQAAPNQIRCTRELSSGTSTAVATCVLTSGTVSSLNLQGTVRAAGTILLKAQITQWSSDPGTTVAKARSMLIARKIG